MKYKIFIIAIMILALSLAGCAKEKDTKLQVGTYILESAEDPSFAPSIVLKAGGLFTFPFSSVSSYLPMGSWSVDGDELILKTDDGKNVYIFIIDEATLTFDGDNSSEIPKYSHFDSVDDGDIFVLKK